MKVAIVLPANLEFAPYVSYYTDILKSKNIDFDYILWNRKGFCIDYSNIHSFSYKSDERRNTFLKIYDYWLFSKFVRKYLTEVNYDLVISFTVISTIFISRTLITKFSGRYIFDIRDYTTFYPLCKKIMTKLVMRSAMNTISSPGYLEWLPKADYILGHNIRKVFDFKSETKVGIKSNYSINILTIGFLRNFSLAKSLIDRLSNIPGISLHFAGDGPAREELEFYSSIFDNVIVSGFYNKEDEGKIVQSATMINLILPEDISFRTAIANRFYLALLYKKPLLVNENSIHAEFVNKYHLGVTISENDDIFQKITDYFSTYDDILFTNGCNELLNVVKRDVDIFKNQFLNILSNYK